MHVVVLRIPVPLCIDVAIAGLLKDPVKASVRPIYSRRLSCCTVIGWHDVDSGKSAQDFASAHSEYSGMAYARTLPSLLLVYANSQHSSATLTEVT